MTAEQVESAIKPIADWLPLSRLVVLENTANKGGGSYYTLEEIRPIRELCQKKGLALHLDGARIFNALVETGEHPLDVGAQFDSISVCLSKGLGAPVGSLLLGDTDFIRRARRVRKAMGGGMRQAGYLAAAGIYALDNHVGRLRDDNAHARILGELLGHLPYVGHIRPVQTNIVIFDVKPPWTAAAFLARLLEKGIKASPFGPQTVRFVTHLDIDGAMIGYTLDVLRGM
jgi:threonine aldolase